MTGSSALVWLAGCTSSHGSADATVGAKNESHDGSHETSETDNHGGENESGHDDGSCHDDGGSHDNGGSHDDHKTELDGPVEHAEVTAVTDDGHHFLPHLVWVKRGGSVTWVNESGTHTVTVYHPDNGKPRRAPTGAAAWDSGSLTEGEHFEHTFDTAGVYDYFCAPHEHGGMVGSVLVGHPDPHEQPGLSDPSNELPSEAAQVITSLNEQTNKALGHEH